MNILIPEKLKCDALRLRINGHSNATLRIADFACYILSIAQFGADHVTIGDAISNFSKDRSTSCLEEWTELLEPQGPMPDGEPVRHG